MVTKTKILQYLKFFEKECPNSVIEKLEDGRKIKKSLGLAYVIDDVNIDKRIGDFPEGAVLYGPIYRKLKTSSKEIMDLFCDSREIPFSKAYEARVGECLEKAILAQLSAQRKRDSFLISGSLSIGDDYADGHAYNIVFKDGNPFLIDIENPLAVDSTGKITHPYIAPILGINEKLSDIIVPERWAQGRAYSLL